MLTARDELWVVAPLRLWVKTQGIRAIKSFCDSFYACDVTITILGIFIVSIRFTITNVYPCYKRNKLIHQCSL